jgi:beta-phosphoglucomutase-like phosphatase (HAD superfamily)
MSAPGNLAVALVGAVIFDFDGTLTDTSQIQHLVPVRELREDVSGPSWAPFHLATRTLKPNADVLALARAHARGGDVVIVVTARPERWRQVTEEWLVANPIPHAELLMRGVGDRRPDAEVKADILADLRARYQVRLAVDDRPSVVDFFRSAGVPTLQVPGWSAG